MASSRRYFDIAVKVIRLVVDEAKELIRLNSGEPKLSDGKSEIIEAEVIEIDEKDA